MGKVIAFLAERTASWDAMFKYLILRKILYILDQFEPVPTERYARRATSCSLHRLGFGIHHKWLKTGNYLYYGSLYKSYISRNDLVKIAATRDE
ncbi:hypothetical protein LUZ60_014532 [Juncus effusus]|nr:hypothetical protein LUZ60_014532 [Juncus effusus]